jgi:PAS domain S-box-containing protein
VRRRGPRDEAGVTPSAAWVSRLGLEAVIEQMPVAVMVVEASSLNIVEFNDVARARTEGKLRRSVAERLDDDYEIFHPDGRPYVMAEWPLMRSMASGQEVIAEEYFHVLADGSRLIARASAAPIYGDRGEIVAAVLVSEDITEEKRVEDELRYHASLLDNVGVIATDADQFRVTAWNQGAERLYGFTAAEALGRPARELATYPEDASRRRLEGELLETGRTRIEFTARRKDGTGVEVELIAVAVTGEGGEISGYLGIHRDISERKRVEARLVQARELERSRIARALHDEPLRALADALALALAARRDAPSGPAEQLVSVLQRSGEQLREAIYDLRLGSRDRPFPQVLEELTEMHREMAGEYEITVEIEKEIAPGALGSKGAEFLQVVGEALTNARRHADPRHVAVRVWSADGSLWAEVSDDGRGFDPTTLGPGMHHGIQGMHERATLLSGQLEIRSELGVGTTVRLQASLAGEAMGHG